MNEAKPIQSLHPDLIANLKAKGIFRCAVLSPIDCRKEPAGSLKVEGLIPGEKPLYRLFCRQHMQVFCEQYGVALPVYPQDGN